MAARDGRRPGSRPLTSRGLALSGLALVTGLALLGAAAIAGAALMHTAAGGTMRINMSATDVDSLDPAIAYSAASGPLEFVTALRLYNYPDKPAPLGSKLQPEAAAGFPRVSKDGKTYTITVKRGFRFSDGTPVTAANFAAALNRSLNPTMQSPVITFMENIVGVKAMLAGKAKKLSGVTAKGNTLTIRLTAPDGGLLAKLGMAFFQAIKTDMAIDKKGISVYPSAGPYYFASRQIGRQILIKKNPYYTGPRPHNVDQFVISVNTNQNQSLLQVKAGEADWDMSPLPATAHAELSKKYGVNKGRYFVHPLVETDYVALNTAQPLFKSLALRKAANYAVDRPSMLRVRGIHAGVATDQILPPTMGGFRDLKAYPLAGPDFAKAKQLAGDKCGNLRLWSFNDQAGQNLAQVLKYDFGQMGCDVTIKLWQGYEIFNAAGKKGAPFDAAIVGWFQDYPDPYDFVDVLLNGSRIQEEHNSNLSYFNVPALNKQMAAANKLIGDARYKAYGSLDVKITRDYAPWAATDNQNQRDFVAERVGGYTFQPSQGTADLALFYLKK